MLSLQYKVAIINVRKARKAVQQCVSSRTIKHAIQIHLREKSHKMYYQPGPPIP